LIGEITSHIGTLYISVPSTYLLKWFHDSFVPSEKCAGKSFDQLLYSGFSIRPLPIACLLHFISGTRLRFLIVGIEIYCRNGKTIRILLVKTGRVTYSSTNEDVSFFFLFRPYFHSDMQYACICWRYST